MQTLQLDQRQTFVQMALKSWNTYVNRADKFFDSLKEEDFQKEVAPGKNRIIYLIGHLIASNDSMISLFGLGERQYGHLDEAFLKNPDRTFSEIPSAAQLKTGWKKQNQQLTAWFAAMTAEEWFSKHTAMTDEDFSREPGRNKLSVLMNRTNHVAYHLGQLVLASAK